MTRTRDKSTVEVVLYTTTDIDGPFIRTDSGARSVYNPDIMVDVVTPRFKNRSAEGEIFIKPMTKHSSIGSLVRCNFWKQRVVPGQPLRRFEWSHEVGSLWQDYVPHEDPVVKERVERLRQLAITAAYARVGSADVATLVELAELKETLSFLYSPVRKMKDLTNGLRRHLDRIKRIQDNYAKQLSRWEKLPAHVKKRREKPKPPELPKAKLGKFEFTDIPSAWLAYRYAIMPLIYSFQDIQKHLDRQVYPERDTARKKEEERIDLAHTGAWGTHRASNGVIRYRTIREGHAKFVARAGVLYAPDWSLNRQLGLQMHRIPSALYETIPLSFVADWFQNGSEVYDALTAELRALKIHGAWITVESEYDYTVRYELEPGDPQTTCTTGGVTFQRKGKWKERKLASLSDVRFMLRVELNGKRIADGLALITTMLATAIKKHGKG